MAVVGAAAEHARLATRRASCITVALITTATAKEATGRTTHQAYGCPSKMRDLFRVLDSLRPYLAEASPIKRDREPGGVGLTLRPHRDEDAEAVNEERPGDSPGVLRAR